MGWDLLSDVSSQALTGAMAGSAARHRALADNIANVDTPGYVRQDVEFEEALGTAVEAAGRAPQRVPVLFSPASFTTQPDRSVPARADGNNVDVDREMVAIAENALRFQSATEALAARVRGLRSAIQGSRR